MNGSEAQMHAMPLIVVALCVFAIAYRFYSKFIATKSSNYDGIEAAGKAAGLIK